MREPPSIPEEQLRACLQDQYDLKPITLEFLPLGLDFYAGVYRVVSEQGTAFVLLNFATNCINRECLLPIPARGTLC